MGKKPFSVDIDTSALDAALAKLPDDIRSRAQRATDGELDDIATDARSFVPQDTMELHDSIAATADGEGGEVTAEARHAAFVEHGTSRTPTQPFMGPAAEQARRRYPDRITDEMRGLGT